MIILAAGLIACAIFLIVPGRPEPRLRRLMPAPETRRPELSPRLVALGTATLVAVGGVSMLGVLPGLVLGVLAAIALPVIMGRLEPRAARQLRRKLDYQLPTALDTLTAALEAGAPMKEGIGAVGQALGDPIGAELTRAARALELGASPRQAWEGAHPSMRPLAEAMTRSADSGAPLAVVLSGASSDARRTHRVAVEVAARSAGVRAVAPLAVCFLPAFFLMGVAPIIASFVEQLLSS